MIDKIFPTIWVLHFACFFISVIVSVVMDFPDWLNGCVKYFGVVSIGSVIIGLAILGIGEIWKL